MRTGFRLLLALVSLSVVSPAGIAADAPVRVWEVKTAIPTYLAGEPELNPMFYLGRASQGAEGRVYPYPLYDSLTHKKVDKTYTLVYLENEYIRIGVLPEIGGRIFEGVDKTNDYHFFYRQHVIKPQLIGLIGAWISGGVEWNIPHHHRASTFIPVQYRTEESPDGSKTVWVGELEIRHRMRWAVGYTLRPGKAYLEVSLRIVNRTPVVNTMLCFANVAVHTNETYQVIFPPSTQFGTHHHKREFINWPVATTRYGGADFSQGVDVSWYKNHIAANSIFAWNYEDDFLAGYDHGKQAGLMAVADHNIVPGKKLWTWGNGPRGRMWDKLLTDEDGPYIELMVGAYSDNQPDYSWLQPYEVKSFQMFWYPFRNIAGVKKANLDAAVNLEIDKDRTATVGFYTTSAHAGAEVSLKAGAKVLSRETVAINPAKPYVKKVKVPEGVDEHDVVASIAAGGRELVSYSPIRLEKKEMPPAVTPPAAPADIKTNEELYLAGLRIEQFHNPTLDPEPYWEEALRRDPGDIRVNTVLGINLFKKARFADAERLFRKALERLTDKYTTPKDMEPLYYLGLALKAQGKQDEAYAWLYKSTWSLAWKAAGYYSVAEIATSRGDFAEALSMVDKSLEANSINVRALNLKAAVLRHLGRPGEAIEVIEAAARLADPLDVRVLAEQWLATRKTEDARKLTAVTTAHPVTALETAAEFMNAGLWQDGLDLLGQTQTASAVVSPSPMAAYYTGYFWKKLGKDSDAAGAFALAASLSPDYVFPFQAEAIDVLRTAMATNPKDPRAPYYLGNLLFDWQPEEATRLWEQAAALDPGFPIVHRNLALAYSHNKKDAKGLEKAIASLEKAVSLPRKHPIHFAELDDLYAAAGTRVEKRLELFEENEDVVLRRDDSLSRAIALKVFAGKYDEAIRLMTGRTFAVWEGGSITVADSWTDAHLLRGHARRAAGQLPEALADYQTAMQVPDNLPSERRDEVFRGAELNYWVGVAYAALGDAVQAKAAWEKSVSLGLARGRRGEGGDTSRFRRAADSQQYYQALALQKLGQTDRATEAFQALRDSAAGSLKERSEIDFFASFGEQQSQRSRLAQNHYLAGLGYLGLGDRQKARQELSEALKVSPDHLAAKQALAAMD